MDIAILFYYTIALIYIIYVVRKRFITPSLVFVTMQTLMFSGILAYVDFKYGADRKLIYIYIVALVMFILGTEFSARVYIANLRKSRVSLQNTLTKNQKIIILAMVVVSILACSYLFISSGYNVFLMILSSVGSGIQDNFTESRIALNNVKGVGYIYQFRVVILPLLCAFLITYKENKKLQRVGLFVLPLMIVFILGTGQRGGFVMFVLMFMVALLYLYKIYGDKGYMKTLVVIGVVSFALFTMMTIFNGRVGSDGSVLQAVLKRIFDDNQECAVIAFRYINNQEIQFGRDWWLSFKDILPGKNSYVQLSYVIFKVIYGNTRGTAPPCIWGSAYYNFGMLGIVVMPFVMGFFYHKVYYKFCTRPITKLRIFLYSAKFVVLGNWIADTPLVLFNQGFITLCLMSFVLNIDRRIKFTNRKK